MDNYSIKCTCHIYISLYWNGQHIMTLDNDVHYMEEIIEAIEKRARMKFREIPIQGARQDFDGLRYRNGGFKRAEQIFA